MDITQINNNAAAARHVEQGQERAAALAEARRRSSAEVRQDAVESTARQEELLAASRDVIARATGANTKLSITKSEESGVFVFKAIDVETGEVVLQWPPEQFAALVKSLGGPEAEALAGLVVDSEA